MLFSMARRLSRTYPIVALVITNLVISMPAPPAKRSPEATDARNGFSNVPKILEIQLPLKIASKDDLVAWARYVMGLMASKINITLTTVKETPTTTSRAPETIKNLENTKHSENMKKLEHRKQQSVNQMGGVRNLANSKNFENARYAANVRNLGNAKHFEVPSSLGPPENGRRSESIRIPLKSENFQPAREKLLVSPQLSTLTINGVTSNSLFNNRQTQPSFTNFGLFDTTVPSPLEITANINLPRAKETVFKGIFSTAKVSEPQLFVPQFPDFGPGIDVRGLPRNLTTVSTPARAYLPVTTADSIKIPNDPFVTRYFFDGVERNVPGNLAVFPSNITFTTSRPSIFNNDIPLPIRNVDLSQRNSSGIVKPLLKVPFEAVITFTRENSGETTTWRNDRDKYVLIPTRDPPDEFPPYFDTNYTLTNESGQINVVFDDGNQVTEPINDSRKEDKKKGGKKQDSSKRQQSKKQKSNKSRSSVISKFLKTFVALRKNNSLTTDLKPPPLDSEKLPKPQRAPVVQKAPTGQRYPPPPRTQTYPEKPPSASGQGRRGQTSLAQQNEDDSGSNSEESTEKSDDDDDNGGNGNDDVESNEGDDNDGSDESSSSESDYDDSDEGDPTFIKTLLDLLNIAAPILEDLSDPESDADIADVLSAGIPLLQELSEGDGDNPGFDIPGILVPILLKFSEDENGDRDSAALLTPLLQVFAPLIGPLVGPLILPLSRQLSNPPGNGGSSVKDLVSNLLAPLLEPVGYGKMSQLSRLIAGVISGLSKYSAGGGKSDIASLVKAVVAGSIAGTSAGSSGNKDSYGAPTSYGDNTYGNKPPTNTYAPVPPKKTNHLLALGDSIKDILNGVVKVVASLVNAVTGILAASSDSSNEPPPAYGPPRPTYGAPRPMYGAPRPSQSFASPPSQSISITTSRPKRFR